MKIYAVTKRHTPEGRAVLQVVAGDILEFERRETMYAGWIWCKDPKGVQAWVPEAYVTIEGSTCRMIRDYDSRELSVEVGERVGILDTESGWARVRTGQNELGWLPMNCLEQIEC